MLKQLLIETMLISTLLFAGITSTTSQSKSFMRDELKELESYLSKAEVQNDAISKVNVAWHLDHSLKVINGIYDSLNHSKVDDYHWNVNPIKIMVFTRGKMRRGVGQSPSYVLPPEQIKPEDLQHQLLQAKANIFLFEELDEKKNFNHPVFGLLARDDAMRFVEIHTRHHLATIRDILKAN